MIELGANYYAVSFVVCRIREGLKPCPTIDVDIEAKVPTLIVTVVRCFIILRWNVFFAN